MIDHIGLAVSNMERSKPFYIAALKPLGIVVVMEVTAEQTGADAHAGFGKGNKAFFWIGGGAKPKGGTHVAFTPLRGPTLIPSTARLWPPADGTMGRRA
jgi:catechol 2,3-dioxygenase-like lactoylglutathione lyase family enzyme